MHGRCVYVACTLHTLIQFKIRNRLPLVRGHEPSVVFSAARQVDDQLFLVVVEGGEHGFQAGHGELGVGEEVGGYDDLLGGRRMNGLADVYVYLCVVCGMVCGLVYDMVCSICYMVCVCVCVFQPT